MLSREQSLAAQEAAFWGRLEEERSRLEADRERGHDLARGWAVVAHSLYHSLCNAVQQANGARRIVMRVVDQKISLEAAREIIADWKEFPEPHPLPEIEAVEPKKPGETKYA